MKNTYKFIYFAVIAAIGFTALSLTGCPTPDDGGGGTETGKETVATPRATPPAGAVASGEKLTLTSTTVGAEIWYTTNGNAPAKNGAGSTKYTSPFAITPPVTVKAIAVKDGMNDSAILEAAYSVVPPFTPPNTDITLLTENIWADGNLTSSSPEQWFKFTATADTQYIHASFGTLSSAMGLYVQVYDLNGAAVGTETNLWSITKYVSKSVTSGQEYYIKVRRYTSSYNGTYQIAFNTSSTVPSATVTMPSNATPLTENIWADGNLTSSSPEQWFKFTATDDTQYIHSNFGTLSSTMGLYVQVYDSSGAAVGTETKLYSLKKNISISVTPGQEYYIKVRLYLSSYTGTYRIAFNKSSTAPSLSSSAITLTENKWTGGNLTSSIGEQWFKFTATDDTQYIHASFGTLSPTMGLKVQVYDSSIVAVESETVLNYRTKYISRSVTPEQVYYIKVQPYDSSYTGTYNIAFNKSLTAPSVMVIPPSSANMLIENIWVNGTLISSSGEQWFKFTATANTQYIHATFGTLFTTAGMNVQVYDSNGFSVVTDSLLYGTGSDSFISLSVTQGQTYYIRVWPNVDTGTYQIAFNKSPTAPGIKLPTSNVTPLTVNIWANGNFDALEGKQWFSFTATANSQYILFKAGTISSIYGVYMQVYDSSGVKVGDMAILPNNTYIPISVTSGQVYYIQVRPAVDKGTYKIAFNASPTAPSP
jgi:tellurite resistance-related uncharacterized protein